MQAYVSAELVRSQKYSKQNSVELEYSTVYIGGQHWSLQSRPQALKMFASEHKAWCFTNYIVYAGSDYSCLNVFAILKRSWTVFPLAGQKQRKTKKEL